ncbi:mannose-binding protein C [Elysia marginata]|uniref:Mannose-binding protein C n=1 Tax=Elysia marginata TaxID=1093978 RepID=A0AAV4FJN9_9GAST|nr:mannose-binding protein C [Elysia marginata]
MIAFTRQLTYTNWNGANPGGTSRRCAIFSFNRSHKGKWMDVDCNSKHPMICEIAQGSSSRLVKTAAAAAVVVVVVVVVVVKVVVEEVLVVIVIVVVVVVVIV